MLVDSHCHLDRLDLDPAAGGLDAVLERAREAGVGHLLCVAINLDAYPAMRRLVEGRDMVSVSVGVHPSESDDGGLDSDTLVRLGSDPAVVAIGETGLDYYYGKEPEQRERQQARFRTHIAAARTLDKPLIVHTRDARKDTLDIIEAEGGGETRGVLHCFTEDWTMARRALDLGLYISFSGIVTFRNAEALREVARRVPADRLLVETDAPYLAPVPKRGKPNEPAYVRYVAATLADIRQQPLEELAKITSDNFFRLFRDAAHRGAASGQPA
ncbi:TatD family hydrolase [Thiohalobacter sp. IOR34]|uniref:TatD family hydrolase n=1 Tax=Thiohalobacter sp. IOR34 TaxID=3057176 RepID=UPI0025B01733|nr:TatD family hydrolase [Thiohalobacter sp. IOR34]WJW74261.1 TatD family hydrolase [Thiohalobacter sp. IOR34]